MRLAMVSQRMRNELPDRRRVRPQMPNSCAYCAHVGRRSSLLDSSEEIREIKDRGELVPDTMVGDALLNNIFDEERADGGGILIDGFPRTALQASGMTHMRNKYNVLQGMRSFQSRRKAVKQALIAVEGWSAARGPHGRVGHQQCSSRAPRTAKQGWMA